MELLRGVLAARGLSLEQALDDFKLFVSLAESDPLVECVAAVRRLEAWDLRRHLALRLQPLLAEVDPDALEHAVGAAHVPRPSVGVAHHRAGRAQRGEAADDGQRLVIEVDDALDLAA